MGVCRIDAPGKAILRFVIGIVRNPQLDSVIGLLECRHHVKDHVLMVVFLDACEIQIRRKPALRTDKHFP